MLDQKSKFTPTGLSTEFVGEAQDSPQAVKTVLEGRAQLVYISPENLVYNEKFRKMLLSGPYKRNLVALVVDEAHCVKTWLAIEIKIVNSTQSVYILVWCSDVGVMNSEWRLLF